MIAKQLARAVADAQQATSLVASRGLRSETDETRARARRRDQAAGHGGQRG